MANITAWVKKVWKDRKTEYPTRRTLTKTNGSQEIVTVARNEGNVSQEGDAFSAANMNDLEERIDAGFTELNGKLSKLLWKGTFTNGSITVPNFSKYRYFLVNVNGVICYGNRNYGIGGYLEYGSYAVRFYGYRFSVKENSDIVSITDLEKGGSNGQENVPITEIYGVF